jgi:osmotically-inducible protein OsmY
MWGFDSLPRYHNDHFSLLTTSKPNHAMKNFAPLLLLGLASLNLGCTTVDTTEKRSQRLYERLQESNLQRYDISAETVNSRVTLTGYVSSEADRLKAEEIALEDPSISRVRNKLKVRSPEDFGTEAKPAFALSKMLLERIKLDPNIHQFNIKTKVVQDKVQLLGEVGDYEDYIRLKEITQELAPVGSFVNFVTVRASLSDQELQALVDAELKHARLATVEAEVLGGILTLRGDLPSFEAVDQTLTSFVNMPDIKDVRNLITVRGQAYPIKQFDLSK